MAKAAGPGVSVSFRPSGSAAELVEPWEAIEADTLARAAPWRTFRWHEGQKHYSGTFWSATENDFVVYESRLELSRLLFADFDRSVRHIVAQPFLLRTEVDGVLRRHVPDYLLLTDAGPDVVDVKPRHRVTRPGNVFTFAWTRRAVESRGWQYEVWSEPNPTELENVRFLAGYRRSWLFDQDVLEKLRAIDLDGAALGAALGALPEVPGALVRSAVLHLLWQQYWRVDLTRPLCRGHVLRRAS